MEREDSAEDYSWYHIMRVSSFLISLESCLRLKYQVIPEIKNEIALKCAREQLSEFRFELKEALQQGIYFLYHVFRDSKKVCLLFAIFLTSDKLGIRYDGPDDSKRG